jgi:polyhydroxyalkanoate synthesis regulator phasin
MIDALKKTLYTGVGLASLTRDKIVELGQELARQANLTEAQAGEFQGELLRKGEEARHLLEAQIDRRVEQVLDRLGVARSEQVAQLTARIAELESELARLRTRSGAPATVRSSGGD